MKILISAYAVCPDMGSEPGMGWNWCVHLAKHCELYIITETEFRAQIEAKVANLPQGRNMHFYWNPAGMDDRQTLKIRRMCWNQGDWRFYFYYKQWQKRTAEIARRICEEQQIDILHQLNMIGFREPGYLWKVSKETDVKFVWGPIGGLKQFPMAYADGAGWGMKAFLRMKNWLNSIQLKYNKLVRGALHQASVLISSIPDSYRRIKSYHHLESVLIPETGCFFDNEEMLERSADDKTLHIIWVGKFDFRKRLDIAFRSIAEVKHLPIFLEVYGSGTDAQEADAHRLVNDLGIRSQICFKGNQPNDVVKQAMREADLFLFTSVNEDTSTVVLEAVSNNLPVLCFDACGMAAVIDESVGIKIPLTNPKQSVEDFAEKIDFLYHHREVLQRLSSNCPKKAQELSWENKAEQMVGIYRKLGMRG